MFITSTLFGGYSTYIGGFGFYKKSFPNAVKDPKIFSIYKLPFAQKGKIYFVSRTKTYDYCGFMLLDHYYVYSKNNQMLMEYGIWFDESKLEKIKQKLKIKDIGFTLIEFNWKDQKIK